MLLLGIDLETGAPFDTPLEENFITEVGAVMWDTEAECPVEIFSELIRPPKGQEISPECVEYTGITNEVVNKYGEELEELFVRGRIATLFKKCDYVVAHNGNAFDKPLMERIFDVEKKTWIDTMIDIEYPNNCKNRNLTYLQCFHGFAYPGHWAIFDIMAMFRIMQNYPLDRIIEVAESPVVTLIAKMRPPSNWKNPVEMARFNKEKDAVKAAGFRWNPDNKTWVLESKKILIESKKFDFQYTFKED